MGVDSRNHLFAPGLTPWWPSMSTRTVSLFFFATRRAFRKVDASCCFTAVPTRWTTTLSTSQLAHTSLTLRSHRLPIWSRYRRFPGERNPCSSPSGEERCPPTRTSRVERVKARVEPSTQVMLEYYLQTAGVNTTTQQNWSPTHSSTQLFRGSTRCESLISSHHSLFTCECNQEDTTDQLFFFFFISLEPRVE